MTLNSNRTIYAGVIGLIALLLSGCVTPMNKLQLPDEGFRPNAALPRSVELIYPDPDLYEVDINRYPVIVRFGGAPLEQGESLEIYNQTKLSADLAWEQSEHQVLRMLPLGEMKVYEFATHIRLDMNSDGITVVRRNNGMIVSRTSHVTGGGVFVPTIPDQSAENRMMSVENKAGITKIKFKNTMGHSGGVASFRYLAPRGGVNIALSKHISSQPFIRVRHNLTPVPHSLQAEITDMVFY